MAWHFQRTTFKLNWTRFCVIDNNFCHSLLFSMKLFSFSFMFCIHTKDLTFAVLPENGRLKLSHRYRFGRLFWPILSTIGLLWRPELWWWGALAKQIYWFDLILHNRPPDPCCHLTKRNTINLTSAAKLQRDSWNVTKSNITSWNDRCLFINHWQHVESFTVVTTRRHYHTTTNQH